MRITLTSIVSVVFLLLACKKDSMINQPIVTQPGVTQSNEVAVQKDVEYRVFSDRNYSAVPWLKDVSFTIKMQIGKTTLSTGSRTLLWDSTFNNLTLGQLPPFQNRILIKKSFPILEKQENLTVSYTLIIPEPLRETRGYFEDVKNGITTVVMPVEL